MLQGDDDYPIDEMRKLGPGVVPALLDIARASKDSYVRSRAISILGDLGCRDTAKVVAAVLADPNPTIRLPAAVAIGKLHADPTPVLVKLLANKDNGVVKFTIKTLATVGDKRAIAPLDKLRTTHAETWLRELAKTALADIRKRHP